MSMTLTSTWVVRAIHPGKRIRSRSRLLFPRQSQRSLEHLGAHADDSDVVEPLYRARPGQERIKWRCASRRNQ